MLRFGAGQLSTALSAAFAPPIGFEAERACGLRQELAKTTRVFAYDLRGHGDSDKPAWGAHVARMAADLRDFTHAMEVSVPCQPASPPIFTSRTLQHH